MANQNGSRERENASAPVPPMDFKSGDRTELDFGPRIAVAFNRIKRATAFEVRLAMIPRHVLILEDSLIIAMEAEDIFQAMGSEQIHIASNLPQAEAVIDNNPIDFALLDVNVGNRMSFDFARMLSERKIPFAFSSGYPDKSDFPADMQRIHLLTKPFGENTVQQMLVEIFLRPE